MAHSVTWATNLTVCPGRHACHSPDAHTLPIALDAYWRGVHAPRRAFGCHCKVNATKVHAEPFCSRSSGGEEIFLIGLADALGLRGRAGTWLEVGGNDGFTTSNTVFMESCRGWRGALIEPEPRAFETMRSARPDALSVHAGLCRTHSAVSLTRRADGQPTGTMAMDDVLAASRAQVKQFRPLRWLQNKSEVERVRVPCAPLGSLLALLHMRRVDVMFVDVEGAEAEALATVDWSAVSIGLISVEATRVNTTNNRRVISLLERAGYTLVACISEWRYHIYDLIFVRPEHFADGAAADASPSARPERLADGADDALPSARARSGQLPARAEAYLRAHHEDRTHDVLRCKAVEANATRRLAFEITPPAALVAPAQG